MKTISSCYCLFTFIFTLLSATAFAEDVNKRLDNLEESVKNQQKTIDALQSGTPSASQQTGGLFGGSSLTNPNISVVFSTFMYSSDLKNEELSSAAFPVSPLRASNDSGDLISKQQSFSSLPR
jgi:hypothetical protein